MAKGPVQITKLLTDHETVNRVQDHFMATLNPVLKTVQAGTKVTGAKGGNAALTNLIAALVKAGIITDGTT